MFTILLPLVFVVVSASATHASNTDTPEQVDAAAVEAVPAVKACAGTLEAPLDYPVKWKLNPADIEPFVAAHPEIKPLLRFDLALARFLNEDVSQEFFGYLGALANFGFGKRFWDEFGLTSVGELGGFVHRHFVLTQILQDAVNRGILPTELLHPDFTHLLTDLLGPLPLAHEITPEEVLGRFGSQEEFKAIGQRAGLSLRAVVTHSRLAQHALLSRCDTCSLVDVERGMELFSARLAGKKLAEAPYETKFMEEAEGLLRGKFPEFADYGPRADLKGARKKQATVFLENDYVAYTLFEFMQNASDTIKTVRRDVIDFNMDDPYWWMQMFNTITESDIFVDQKLQPYFMNLMAEQLLHGQTIAGPGIASQIRARLEKNFSNLRGLARDFKARRETSARLEQFLAKLNEFLKASPAASAPMPTRADRMRSYAERKSRFQMIDNPTGEQDEVPFAVVKTQESKANLNDEFWEDLLSPKRALPQARALFSEKILAEETYTITTLRDGFRYRFQLSENLHQQLIGSPKKGEPEDFRKWLGALRMGAARSDAQRGWRRLKAPLNDRYTWIIQLADSNYVILGFRSSEGTWRFESIESMPQVWRSAR